MSTTTANLGLFKYTSADHEEVFNYNTALNDNWDKIDTAVGSSSTITVDQTYDSTSANAQSGIAINGANFIQNTATGTQSFSAGGTPTVTTGSTNIGYGSQCSAGNYATALGHNANGRGSSAVAIGRAANASGSFAVALGYGATCSGGKSIQLGYGTNNTVTSLSVGFQNVGNYQLLDGETGLIPDERISSNIARTEDIPSAVTESTVSGWGFTKNTGTITGITMNGSSKGTSGVVNLGTVLTAHQDISGKENTSNKVTSLSASSTNTQYPTAKCVYDALQNAGSAISITYDL